MMRSMVVTTRGKSRGGRKTTRGRNLVVAAAGQLAHVSEGESSAAAAGQRILVGEEGTVRDVERGMEGSSSVAPRPQVVSFFLPEFRLKAFFGMNAR